MLRAKPLIIILIFIGLLPACKNIEENKPLNVLLITADDMNYNSVGAYGCEIPSFNKLNYR